MELVLAGGQSVITTTELEHVPGAESRGVRLVAADGRPPRAHRRCRHEAPGPRPLGAALERSEPVERTRHDASPASSRAWDEVAGDAVAAEARPASERAGTVTLRCESAVWAQELELLSGDLLRSA